MAFTIDLGLDENPDRGEIQRALRSVALPENISEIRIEIESDSPPEANGASSGLDEFLDVEVDTESETDVDSDDVEEEAEDVETVRIKQSTRKAEILSLLDEFLEEAGAEATNKHIIEYALANDWDIPETTISTYLAELAKNGVLAREKQNGGDGLYVYDFAEPGREALDQLSENDDAVVEV